MLERWSGGSSATALGKEAWKDVGEFGPHSQIVVPIMEIRAPRGSCILWSVSGEVSEDHCAAIKAFMKQHKDE